MEEKIKLPVRDKKVRLQIQKRFVALRKKMGWTQEDAGDAFGVGKITISWWENGVRNLSGPAIRLLELYEKEAKRKGKKK